MAMYRTCPYCGSNLDPGETCDCQEKENAAPDGSDPEAAQMNKHHHYDTKSI